MDIFLYSVIIALDHHIKKNKKHKTRPGKHFKHKVHVNDTGQHSDGEGSMSSEGSDPHISSVGSNGSPEVPVSSFGSSFTVHTSLLVENEKEKKNIKEKRLSCIFKDICSHALRSFVD